MPDNDAVIIGAGVESLMVGLIVAVELMLANTEHGVAHALARGSVGVGGGLETNYLFSAWGMVAIEGGFRHFVFELLAKFAHTSFLGGRATN